MRICLIDNRRPRTVEGGATYVGRLAPALADDHRVTIVTVEPGVHHVPWTASAVGRAIAQERPEVVHVNNLVGAELATVLWAIAERAPVALTLHDDGLLHAGAAFNRWLAGGVGLVISPTHHLLEQHTNRGFFRHALHEVLPYGLDAAPSPEPLSATESFPVAYFDTVWAIQQAFQSGTLVIAPRTGGIPELVRDSVNGILVEPGDSSAVKAATERLAQSPELAARLRTAAYETARLCDMRYHVARISQAYRRLVTHDRTGGLDQRAA